jgi:hypothetical protein
MRTQRDERRLERERLPGHDDPPTAAVLVRVLDVRVLLERAKDDHVALVVELELRRLPVVARPRRRLIVALHHHRQRAIALGCLEPFGVRLDRLTRAAGRRGAPRARLRVADRERRTLVVGAAPIGARAEVVGRRPCCRADGGLVERRAGEGQRRNGFEHGLGAEPGDVRIGLGDAGGGEAGRPSQLHLDPETAACQALRLHARDRELVARDRRTRAEQAEVGCIVAPDVAAAALVAQLEGEEGVAAPAPLGE